MFCEVWLEDDLKKWSSHLLDNLSDCLLYVHLKSFQVSSTGLEPMASAMPVQYVLLPTEL